MRPLVWIRYIDDIFFIWTGSKESLNTFVSFTNDYTDNNKMKSRIKFETNISENSVNFLDVKVNLNNGKITTDLYTKPTGAHLFLNATSSHPTHTIRNIPKGQFIRIRRICTEVSSYSHHCKKLIQQLINRGYKEKELLKQYNECKDLNRNDLLQNVTRGSKN